VVEGAPLLRVERIRQYHLQINTLARFKITLARILHGCPTVARFRPPNLPNASLKRKKAPHPFRIGAFCRWIPTLALRAKDDPRAVLECQKHARFDVLGRLVKFRLAKRKAGKRLLAHNPILRVSPDQPVIDVEISYGIS